MGAFLFSTAEGNREGILYERPIRRAEKGGKEEREVFSPQGISLFDKGIDPNDASFEFSNFKRQISN
jgi:hypothetical protein